MEDYRDAQTCKAKVGLLFLRDCGSMVKNVCVTCGRPVCRNHSVDSDQGVVCPECAAQENTGDSSASVKMAQARQGYYRGYGYRPYYYGHSMYYSDSDYRTFDGQEVVYEEPPAGSDDFYAVDDHMES